MGSATQGARPATVVRPVHLAKARRQHSDIGLNKKARHQDGLLTDSGGAN